MARTPSTEAPPAADLTVRDLRTRLRLTQRAFHDLTGIARSEISLLERGQIERPHEATVGAYTLACNITSFEFQQAVLNSRRLHGDPALEDTLLLEARIAELLPRRSAGQRIDRSGNIFALGQGLYRAATGEGRILWHQLAARAERLMFLEGLDKELLRDTAIPRAGLFAVMRLCAANHEAEFAPLASLWRKHAIALLETCLAEEPMRAEVEAEWVFDGAIPLAQKDPVAFLRDEGEFQDRWVDAEMSLLDERDEPGPVASQLFAYAQLLAGISEGVRERAQGSPLPTNDRVLTG